MPAFLGCLNDPHDSGLLLASYAVCLLGAFTARVMVLRGRAASESRTCWVWLGAAGAVAGAGVWGTHFIAILAYAADLPMGFDPGLTLLSAATGMLLSALGFALSFSRLGGAVGGTVVGAGVIATHFVGMAALRYPVIAFHDARFVTASVLLGLAVGGLAGHFAAGAPTRRNNIVTVTLRVATVVLVHFCAMAGVHYLPQAGAVSGASIVQPESLALLVMAVIAFILGQALILTLVDRHLERRAQGEARRQRAYIAELEQTKASLEVTSAELGAALEQARAASRSKSAFLASMSHELRTPLNAVIGFSEIMRLQKAGPLSERYLGYLDNIHDSGSHLLSLINDILDIARFDAGHGELSEEVFDLGAKLNNTLAMLSSQAIKARVQLTSEIAPDLPLVNGDRRRIRQVLINLLSNALKFTPPGGTVTLRALTDADGLVLQVCDTGIGIAAQDFAKVLEPFGQVDSTLSRKYEGTGLGLPLSRQMAEMHGGSLTLDSVADKGTTVTVRLPAWRLQKVQRCAAA